MQPGPDRQPRAGGREREHPWDSEESCRVLSQQGSGEGGGVVYCICEGGLYTIRVRARAGCGPLFAGDRLILPNEEDEGGDVATILGGARYRDMPAGAQAVLTDVVHELISDLPDKFLAFYNRAGNLSRKFHAFQLLPGIGPSKAIKMVEARGRLGWDTFTEVDEACDIDSTQLLCDRLVEELKDPQMTPSLLDHVVRIPDA